jgi:hypothetical protein
LIDMRLASSAGVLVLAAAAACSPPKTPTAALPPMPSETAHAKTAADRILPLLPDGAQVVVELDLARLRGNAVVGDVATRALASLGEARVPGLPVAVAGSPLATADALVLASYGVGTSQAATVAIVATKDEVAGATRIAPDLVALGPTEWIAQLQTRVSLGGTAVAPELAALRDHAMPEGAKGAVLRAVARLPFDARVALARETGLDGAPAQLSVWGDVADDLAIVIDADAADPGDRRAQNAAKRLAAALHGALVAIANAPIVRAIGVPYALADARLVQRGTWVRAIVEIEPRPLARAVERAAKLLGGAS